MTATLTRREFGAGAAGIAATSMYCNQLHELTYNVDENGNNSDDMEYVLAARADGFGDRLRKAREARGLTIEQCAHVIDPSNPNFWYAHWEHLEQGGEWYTQSNMKLWPTIEALLGVPITTLLYGGSELAIAKQWAKERLTTFEPDSEIGRDEKQSPICDRIKRAREWRGLSIAQAAETVDVTERDWERFENGGFPLGLKSFEIARALNIDCYWLAFGDTETGSGEIPPTA